MEPLAYVELAVTYEESGGSLSAQWVRPSLSLRKMKSWGAIAALLLLGGFGTALSTAFTNTAPRPAIEQPVTPR